MPTGWRLTQIACNDADSSDAGPTPAGVSSTATLRLSPGETVVCTFTNTKNARVKIIKDAIGGDGTEQFTFTPTAALRNGSTPNPALDANNQFPLADGGSQDFLAAIPDATGAYTVTETVPGGWRLTQIACSDADSTDAGPTAAGVSSNMATIKASPGETVICTFTNTKNASVKIVKEAIGGDGTESFTFTPNAALVSGSTASPALDNGTFALGDGDDQDFNAVIPGGTYSVTETVPAGWRLTEIDCDDSDSTDAGPAPGGINPATASISVSPGEELTCTFTNNKAANITIIKDAIGGAPGDTFTFTPNAALVAASTPVPALNGGTFALADGGSQQFTLVVPATGGAYSVAESVPTGWRLTQIDCDDSDSTSTAATPEGLGSSTATINVDPGESITCTFTNTKNARVKIIKDAVGGDGTEQFTFSPNAALRNGSTAVPALDANNNFALADDGSQDFSQAVPDATGAYTVSETVPTGWRLTQIACNDADSSDAGPTPAGVGSTATLRLSPGETVVCTFTNTKNARVKIIKQAVGGDGTEQFTFSPNATLRNGSTANPALDANNQFALADDGSQDFSNAIPEATGAYTVAEDVPAGWRLTQIACSDADSTDAGPTAAGVGSSTATLRLSPGETVVCTFTNTKNAKVTIVKDAIGGDGTESFTFTPNAALVSGSTADPALSGGTFALGDGDDQDFNAVIPGGTYSVAETVPAGWRLTEIDCDDSDSTDAGPAPGGINPATASISVSPGEELTCTFTNNKAANITIIKDAIGGAPGDTFTFTPNAALVAASTPVPALNGGTFALADGGSQQFTLVVPATGGTYSVAETVPTGWRLTEIDCSDSDSTNVGPTPAGLGSSTATINVDPGESITCTFTNTKNARVKIIKQAVGGDGTEQFTFSPNAALRNGSTPVPALDGNDQFALADDGSQDFSAAIPDTTGAYTVTESVPTGWRLTQITCSDADSTDAGPTAAGVSSNTATIKASPGETVICTFTNTKNARVKIIKQTVGGDGTESFTFTPSAALRTNSTPNPALDANNQFALVDDGSQDFLAAIPDATGAYTVAETVPAGWRLTQIACSDADSTDAGPTAAGVGSSTATIKASPGETVICTFTNTQNASVTIVKEAIGGAPADSFTFTPNDNLRLSSTAAPPLNLQNQFALTNNGQQLFSSVIPNSAGSYTVTESVPVGWRLTRIVCNDGDSTTTVPTPVGLGSPTATINVSPGEAVTCTFTNTKNARVKIIKQAIGGTGTESFTFSPSTQLRTSSTAVPPLDANNQFGLTNGASQDFSQAIPDESGDYTVTETVPEGWRLTQIDCSDGNSTDTGPTAGGVSSTATIKLSPGETLVCTFTNTKNARLRIIKQAVGGTGSESFTFSPSSDLRNGSTPVPALDANDQFALTNGGAQDFSAAVPDTTGAYTVTESVPTGWRLTRIVCSDSDSTSTAATPEGLSSSTATIKLSPGETLTCTFTNTKNARVKIIKQAIGGDGTESFTFTPNATLRNGSTPNPALDANNQFALGDGQSQDFSAAIPNSAGGYTVAETVPTGWRLTRIVCNDADSTSTADTPTGLSSSTATINVSAGETVVCTFTNTKQATVRIVKDAIGGGANDSFTFTPNAALRAAGTADPALNGSNQFVLGNAGVQTFNSVVPNTTGAYTVAETVPATWRLTQIDCSDGDSTDAGPTNTGLGSSTATIRVAAGETVTCTYTNVKDGKIEIRKQLEPATDTGRFNLAVDGTTFATSVGDNQGTGEIAALPGDHTFAEAAANTQLSRYDTTINCFLDGTSTTKAVTGANTTSTTSRGGTVNVGPGQDVVCELTNARRNAQITLVKDVVPNGDGGTFDLRITNSANATVGSKLPAADGEGTGAVAVPPGTYTVGETAPNGAPAGYLGLYTHTIKCVSDGDGSTVKQSNGDATSMTVDLESNDSVTCTITNTRKARAGVLKTLQGQIDPSHTWTFTLKGPGVDVTDTTAADGTVDFNGALLLPGEKYTICEILVPAGWSTHFFLNGVELTLYNPNANDPVPENLGTYCYDFTPEPGQVFAFAVDNRHPLGGQRTIGYWKNWNRCTSGNQARTADKNGGAAEGFYLVEDVLPALIGDLNVNTCAIAVRVLGKQDQKTGKSQASDAAYGLAAQMLAAIFNVKAQAKACDIQQTIDQAQTLLDTINFVGAGPYLPSKTTSQLQAQRRSQALALAKILDDYNNGKTCF